MDTGHNVIRIVDCHYLRDEFAAAFLVIEGDRALFVESNTARAVPFLLDALKQEGLRPEQVEHVVITHVHLDHAGGSSALMQACPNATLLAHPKAARHMVDPSRLVASARKVYGDDVFDRLYGDISPIKASRVREMSDEEELQFGSRTLRFLHTRGHANHHFCVYDSSSQSVFTGDAFGLAYPALQKRGLFIFPSTSPTEFEPEEAIRSVDRIVDTGAKRAYLTHFGEISNLVDAASQMKAHLTFSGNLLNEAVRSAEPDERLAAYCEERLRVYFGKELDRRGLGSDAEAWELLRLDLELNAAGIAHLATKLRLG